LITPSDHGKNHICLVPDTPTPSASVYGVIVSTPRASNLAVVVVHERRFRPKLSIDFNARQEVLRHAVVVTNAVSRLGIVRCCATSSIRSDNRGRIALFDYI
jgi:hypothetical protein